ncbi:MAG: hypothetical protein IE925_06185 [Rhodobacterales bacterium]|nr:hypothetical protein [Rhodobacterales bacterium]
MHPQLRIYFDFVWPLFWPWLVWNLLRVARWHTETGRDALMAVDRFGNIRFVQSEFSFLHRTAPAVPGKCAGRGLA